MTKPEVEKVADDLREATWRNVSVEIKLPSMFQVEGGTAHHQRVDGVMECGTVFHIDDKWLLLTTAVDPASTVKRGDHRPGLLRAYQYQRRYQPYGR